MSKRATIILPIAIAAAGALVLWFVFPLLKSPGGALTSTRTSALWSLYQITTTGAATGRMWFKKPPVIPSWPGGAVMIGAAIFLLFYLLFSWRKVIRKSSGDTLVLRFCIWCLLMFAAIFVQIVLTPQAGGPHHTVMLFPLDLLACFAAAFLFIRALPLHQRFPAILLESIFFLIWTGAEVRNLQYHFSRFGQANSFWGRWSPRIERLAKYLNVKGRKVDAIYCVEWGVGNQLAALCQPEIGRKIRDNWPTFQDWSAQKEDAQAIVARFFPAQEKDIYVTFSKDDAVFPLAQSHFAEMEALAGKATQPEADLPHEIRETYQVFKSRKR